MRLACPLSPYVASSGYARVIMILPTALLSEAREEAARHAPNSSLGENCWGTSQAVPLPKGIGAAEGRSSFGQAARFSWNMPTKNIVTSSASILRRSVGKRESKSCDVAGSEPSPTYNQHNKY